MSSIVWIVTLKIQMKSKFFRVTCKCGHVGRQFFVRVDFPVNADSGKEAAEIARFIPRVKHDHKDAILNCVEIDYEEYVILQKINDNDPYLKCKNPQEQAHIYGFAERLETEPKYEKQVIKSRKDVVEFKNKKRKLVEDSLESYQMDCRNWFSLEESLAY